LTGPERFVTLDVVLIVAVFTLGFRERCSSAVARPATADPARLAGGSRR